jgi:hypothetical protein
MHGLLKVNPAPQMTVRIAYVNMGTIQEADDRNAAADDLYFQGLFKAVLIEHSVASESGDLSISGKSCHGIRI